LVVSVLKKPVPDLFSSGCQIKDRRKSGRKNNGYSFFDGFLILKFPVKQHLISKDGS